MLDELFAVRGKLAVVTGSGRGLGADIACAFAEAGATVYLLSRSEHELSDVAARIRQAGGMAVPVVCDLLNDAELQGAFKRLPRLDILVNNAGTNLPAPLEAVSIEQLDLMLNLNVRATFLATQAAARRMLEGARDGKADGAIINITSQMGHVGAVDRSIYCMTKHAVEGLTKAAALDLAGKGIRVNSIAPTFVDTPMTQPFFENESFKRWVHDRIPMGRLLESREVAAAALYLASPAAAMMTGTSLRIDGGWTAQ